MNREAEFRKLVHEIFDGSSYLPRYNDEFRKQIRQVYTGLKSVYQLGVKDGILMKEQYEKR